MAIAPEITRPTELPPLPETSHYFNRERSWLEFNRRVLEEALDERNPLLERVKFLSIFSTNLDEFFMIRVAGIKQQVAAGVVGRSPDGTTPAEQLIAIRRTVDVLTDRHRRCWLDDVQPNLRDQGIRLLDYAELTDQQRAFCKAYFEREVFPVLTPLAFDPSHPFPQISNLSINLAVVINDPEEGEHDPRERVQVARHDEQVIAENVDALFPGMEVVEAYVFRITRNADMEIQEEEAADLLRTIEQGVRQRRFGAVVRLTIQHDMPQRIRDLLLANLKITPDDLYEVEGSLGLSDLMGLMKIDRPDLKDPPFYPGTPPLLRNARSSTEIFSAIRQQDILLHHPFDSFRPIVELIEAAAEDEDVLAIKQTLYRVGSNSPIVKALMHARDQDKQVTVLVELKARFDEENNITWARALERAGVHVVYGLVGLKTHAKIALIVRREYDGLRRYVHLGTGNYNAATARIYTDLGLLTCNPELGADASDLFNLLTGYSRQHRYRKLLVAPVNLRERLTWLIEREITHANSGRGGSLIFKLNSLVDPQMIELLYRASRVGVKVELIVRGMCCLRPGVAGLSENIIVRSVVGRFLEHSRIYYFENGGDPAVYLGSADLMQRNLDRRIETLFPIEEPVMIRHIREDLLATYLNDNIRAKLLMPDGSYVRAQPEPGSAPRDSQAFFAAGHDTPPE